MPRMLVTPLGRNRLYLRRDMIAEDGTAEIEPSCVEPALKLGYVEELGAPPATPARRGRPPKAVAGMAPEVTRAELLEEAKELGVELPSGYVRKDELAELVEEAKADDSEES